LQTNSLNLLSNYLKPKTLAQNRKFITGRVCCTLILVIWRILIFVATGLYSKIFCMFYRRKEKLKVHSLASANILIFVATRLYS
jgi:hypothetical protein